MARWRDTKKGKDSKTKEDLFIEEDIINANPFHRLKGFIIDMFLIMMPIMYITTYLVMDGKDDFQNSQMARWVTSFIYGAIVVAFWYFKAQTPGLKAYDLKIVDETTKTNLSFVKSIIRYIIFLISAMSIVGWFIPFFRKDKATLQDIAVNSIVITENNKK